MDCWSSFIFSLLLSVGLICHATTLLFRRGEKGSVFSYNMEGKQRRASYDASLKHKVILYAEKKMVIERQEGSSMYQRVTLACGENKWHYLLLKLVGRNLQVLAKEVDGKVLEFVQESRKNGQSRGNPLLKSVCQVPWEYEEIIPDYVMGKTTCALFLSLRYHNLNPDYINERLKLLGKQYELRVLLVQVDIPDPHHVLKNLTRICLLTDMTLMLAWSPEEAGRIIETYKIYENKPPDKIMGRKENTPYLMLVKALTSIRSVNKTDAANLLTTFGSLEKILKASPATLALCPGVGPRKATQLHKVLHQQFLKTTARQKQKK